MAAAPILRALSSYPTHTLLDSQWDAVYLVIRRLGFIPPEFERGTTVPAPPTKVVPQLVHTPTDFKFTFDYDQNRRSHVVWFTQPRIHLAWASVQECHPTAKAPPVHATRPIRTRSVFGDGAKASLERSPLESDVARLAAPISAG